MEIVWTPKGFQSLQKIQEFIAQDSKSHADQFTLEVLNKVEVLTKNPSLGRIIPEIGEESKREMIHGNYRVLYYWGDKIYVFRVIHSSQNFHKIDLRIDI